MTENPTPPTTHISPGWILAIIITPSALGIPFSYHSDANIDFASLLLILYALNILAGITCAIVFLFDGLRIKREGDEKLTVPWIIFRALLFGIVCGLASGALLFGACLCYGTFVL